jgi:hypothetical protein
MRDRHQYDRVQIIERELQCISKRVLRPWETGNQMLYLNYLYIYIYIKANVCLSVCVSVCLYVQD